MASSHLWQAVTKLDVTHERCDAPQLLQVSHVVCRYQRQRGRWFGCCLLLLPSPMPVTACCCWWPLSAAWRSWRSTMLAAVSAVLLLLARWLLLQQPGGRNKGEFRMKCVRQHVLRVPSLCCYENKVAPVSGICMN